jgi:hypothetical protein
MGELPSPLDLYPGDFQVSKLRLQPGDIVLVRTRITLYEEQIKVIRDRVEEIVGPGNKVVILSSGLDIKKAVKHEIGAMRAAALEEFNHLLKLFPDD